jgi:hypothetical protein
MSEYKDEKGVCFFVYNNEQIDYVDIALLAAKYVKTYLDLPVCIITDAGTYAWMQESFNEDDINDVVDYIKITNDEFKPNMRRHYDSPWTKFKAQFSNSNKHKIWEYSPFEKTLLLDTDYIVKNDFLLNSFNLEGVSMFSNAISIRNDAPAPREVWLYDNGIKMWWSTVVYFDRSELSEMFFGMWAHVADNYGFYQFLYNFPSNLFRTDYCVSIAVHLLNGMEESDVIHNFDDTPMYYVGQKDDIVSAGNIQDWVILAHDTREEWKNILVKHSNLDLHVMNKRALTRLKPALMEYFNE